jgi:hypothetical protein
VLEEAWNVLSSDGKEIFRISEFDLEALNTVYLGPKRPFSVGECALWARLTGSQFAAQVAGACRGFVPQAQAVQQRPKHAPAPPSYGKASSSSNVHRRERHLASVQIKLEIFTLFFYSPVECSSPVAASSGLGTGLNTTIKNARKC